MELLKLVGHRNAYSEGILAAQALLLDAKSLKDFKYILHVRPDIAIEGGNQEKEETWEIYFWSKEI